jgi:hypothetical protein
MAIGGRGLIRWRQLYQYFSYVCLLYYVFDIIYGVMVNGAPRLQEILGSIANGLKPKTIKLIFVASPQNT